MVLGFQIVLRLTDQYIFYVTITRDFERFQYFDLETSFLKN